MQKKSILLVYYKLFKAGGVAKVMTNLANELVAEGYNVEILLLSGEQTPFYALDERVKIHYADMFQHWAWDICELNEKYLKFIPKIQNINAYISHIGVFLLLKSWLGKNHHRYDTIISCWYKLSKFISFLPKVRKKTYAWEHISHTAGGLFYNKILRNRYKYLKGIVAINTPEEGFYKKINPNTIKIYNIMDGDCENKTFIPADKKKNIISMVCRLDPEKNVSEFLDIIKEINLPNDWEVHIMGAGYQEQMLKEKIQNENLHNIKLLGRGNVEQVYELMGKSKIHCLSSLAEGFGLVLVEAMFHSNVLMAYDCKYGPSDIINERNGYLIPLGDKEMFKEKLKFLLSDKNELNNLMKSSFQESQKWKKENRLNQWKELFEK